MSCQSSPVWRQSPPARGSPPQSRSRWTWRVLFLILSSVLAFPSPSGADIGVIVLEPISALGFFTRVGHAGTYFSNICPDGSPIKMRLCLPMIGNPEAAEGYRARRFRTRARAVDRGPPQARTAWRWQARRHHPSAQIADGGVLTRSSSAQCQISRRLRDSAVRGRFVHRLSNSVENDSFCCNDSRL